MKTNNKLREALKDIGRLVEQIHFLYSDYPSEIHEIARKVNDALAEPVKNYEVGTVEEQNKRLCSNYFSIRRSDHSFTRTALEWAQMPYTEGGAK